MSRTGRKFEIGSEEVMGEVVRAGAAVVRARRIEYLLFVSYVLPGLLLGFAALLWHWVGLALALPLVLQAAMTLAVPALVRRDALTAAGHLFMGSFVVAMIVVGTFTGGATSPAILPLAVAGPLGVLVLERGSAAIWVGLAAVAIAIGAWAELSGVGVPSLLTGAPLQWMQGGAAIAVTVVLFVLLLRYQGALDSGVLEVSAVNERLRHAGAELDRASLALASSAAAFAGSGNNGLVVQMMTGSAKGRRAIAEARNRLQSMFAQYRDIDERVLELHRRTEDIVEQIANIDRIWAQLDLMALNVGIEAAGVGQAGRGFALLAADMRRLAERVSKETSEIKATLRSVHGLSQEVGAATTKGTELAERGSGDLEELATRFEEVLALVDRAAHAARATTDSVRVQLDAIHDLVDDGSAAD